MTDQYVGKSIAGNQFRIVQKIGSGGMGAVYKAEQPEMNRFVGIKILHAKYLARTDLVSRFRREARAMSHLSHPNTARVFLYGQLEDGSCYFVMEYLEGRNLAQIVRAEGPMDPERAINIMVQVCGALEEAHQVGIIHRDLKPENIFLTQQGGIRDYPKVLDFGLAKVTEREMRPGSLILTQEGMVFGTPEFMSPEQARGEKLDGRSDIYSLGVILYELLTGKLPFDAKQPMDYIHKHINEPPLPLATRAPGREFPPGLEEALQRSLAKKREDRFPTATAFAQSLRDVVRGQMIAGVMRSLPSSPPDATQSNPDHFPSGNPQPNQSWHSPAQGFPGPGQPQPSGTHAPAQQQPAQQHSGPSPQPHGQAGQPHGQPHGQQAPGQAHGQQHGYPPGSQYPAPSYPHQRPRSSTGNLAWVVFGIGLLLALGGFIALAVTLFLSK